MESLLGGVEEERRELDSVEEERRELGGGVELERRELGGVKEEEGAGSCRGLPQRGIWICLSSSSGQATTHRGE